MVLLSEIFWGIHQSNMSKKQTFLPKPVYEILPLLYLSLGAAGINASHSLTLDILAAYLIARGLFNIILRINYRSPHQALTKGPVPRRDR